MQYELPKSAYIGEVVRVENTTGEPMTITAPPSETIVERSKQMVKVPRWALELVLHNADFADDGPGGGEGWRSPEMKRALEALEASMP